MKKSSSFAFATILGIFLTPQLVSADVIISEAAWMGTAENASDEWIELHNTGSDKVSLEGWKLTTGDGGINETLSGSVGAGGNYLLERTDDASAKGATADFCYTGSLANGGEVLILKNGSGGEEQELDASGGWPAGDNDTKETMQWTGSGWTTRTPTPEADDTSKTPCGEKKEEERKNEKEESGEKKNSENDSNQSESEISSHNSPESIKDFDPIFGIIAEAGRERIGVVGSPIIFKAKAETLDGKLIERADYSWTFGDGYQKDGEKVRHTYLFPGTYHVILRAEHDGYTAVDRTTVRIRDLNLAISSVQTGKEGFVEISNQGKEEINIGGFEIQEGESGFSFPSDTILAAGMKIKFSNALLGLPLKKEVRLYFPNDEFALEYEIQNSEEKRGGKVFGARISSIQLKLAEAKEKLALLVGLRNERMNVSRQTLALSFQSKQQDEQARNSPRKIIESKKEEEKKEKYLDLKESSSTTRATAETYKTIAVVHEQKSWWGKFWDFIF